MDFGFGSTLEGISYKVRVFKSDSDSIQNLNCLKQSLNCSIR